jgi:hypothetical protein
MSLATSESERLLSRVRPGTVIEREKSGVADSVEVQRDWSLPSIRVVLLPAINDSEGRE